MKGEKAMQKKEVKGGISEYLLKNTVMLYCISDDNMNEEDVGGAEEESKFIGIESEARNLLDGSKDVKFNLIKEGYIIDHRVFGESEFGYVTDIPRDAEFILVIKNCWPSVAAMAHVGDINIAKAICLRVCSLYQNSGLDEQKLKDALWSLFIIVNEQSSWFKAQGAFNMLNAVFVSLGHETVIELHCIKLGLLKEGDTKILIHFNQGNNMVGYAKCNVNEKAEDSSKFVTMLDSNYTTKQFPGFSIIQHELKDVQQIGEVESDSTLFGCTIW